MALVTRTLNNNGDPISYPDGSVATNRPITFQLVDFEKRQPVSLFDAAGDGGEYVVGNLLTAQTDAAGYFSIPLWPNNRGEALTVYKVSLPGTTIKPFYVQITEGTGEQSLLSAKAAVDAVQPQVLSLFDALLANIINVVNTATAIATRTVNGLMSAEDKVKLDDLTAFDPSGFTVEQQVLIDLKAPLATPSFTGLLKSAGNALFGKTVDDGLAKIQSSNGITLGNSGNSSPLALDWYEEGTWTPVMQLGGASTGLAGTFTCAYTRIGNRVMADYSVTLTALGTSTGFITISAPFVAAGNSTGAFDPVAGLVGVNTTAVVAGIAAGSSSIYLLLYSGASRVPLTEANLTNTSQFRFSLTYKV